MSGCSVIPEVADAFIQAFSPILLLQMPQTVIIVGSDIFYLGSNVWPADGLSALIDEIHATLAALDDME